MQSELSFHHEKISSNLLEISIKVTASLAALLQEKTIQSFKHHVKPFGLEGYTIPTEFIVEKYNTSITKTIEHFALRHLILDALSTELKRKKILIIHQPRLIECITTSDRGLIYKFRVSMLDSLSLGEWKKFPFKSPKRKLYKDLDKQVEAFCEREGDLFDEQKKELIEDGDWIEIEATILDNAQKPLIDGLKHKYWFKFSTKYISDQFKQTFIGKRVGDVFVSDSFRFSDGLNEPLSERSQHLVKIISNAKGTHFSVEMFKLMFNLKNKTEIHKKLIEVFSFRNDISQRKSIIEEVFTLLLSKQRFEIPQHLTLRKQEDLLNSLRRMPDYHVYKAHKNFSRQLEKLAEKQLKEEALIDSVAFKENILASREDIQSYLHLFNHDRLREFVYFKPVIENFDELDAPVAENILIEAVIREKTLNSIIYQLSR